MTLDEAIKHCDEKAKELKEESEHEKQNQLNKVKMFNGHFPADYTKANSCLECAREHEQLAEWLKDYKAFLTRMARPQGEWVNHRTIMHDGEYYCSSCGEVAEWLDGGSQFLSNFCPNCGAQMHGGENE